MKAGFRESYNIDDEIFTIVRHKPYEPAIVVSVYHDLCDAIETVNSTFTFPLNFAFFFYFFLNLFAIYNHIWTASSVTKNLGLVLMTDGPWVVFSIFFQSFMCYMSNKTTQEAEKTAVVVSKIINSSGCIKSHRKAFKVFLLQNHYRNLRFQTSFFTINWRMMLMVSLNM